MQHPNFMVPAFSVASLLLVPYATVSAAEPSSNISPPGNPNLIVTLGGEAGEAATASIKRFRAAPYDSPAWLRADLPKHQRPGGYFAASGTIDWQQPIDFKSEGGGTMMPALWGNARLLCGLVEAGRAFKDASLLETVKRLGDFHVGLLPRFTDPGRMAEYTGGVTFAAGYVTCYFPAMEGLVKLHRLSGERKYLDAAITMAEFYRAFDRLPIDHAHGMLCNQVSLLLLYESTRQMQYLERIEEAAWCCTFHGQLGFVHLRAHLAELTDGALTRNFALDFTRADGAATMVSEILPAVGDGEVLRQRIRLSGLPATVVRVRQPHWADAVTAIAADGKALPLANKDGFFATSRPVSEAVFIFGGGLYAATRHCARLSAGPVAGEPFVLGYGPNVLASLGRTATTPEWPASLTGSRALGLIPFSAAMLAASSANNSLTLRESVIHHVYHKMKTAPQDARTATVRELRNRFAEVAKWIADGEEVTITRNGTVFATLAPAQPRPAPGADWVARFKKRQPIRANRKLTKAETLAFYDDMKGGL